MAPSDASALTRTTSMSEFGAMVIGFRKYPSGLVCALTLVPSLSSTETATAGCGTHP